MVKITNPDLQMILTWPDGEYNVNTLIEAKPDGIELADGWIGTIPWEWIDRARAKLERKGDRRDVVARPVERRVRRET